jgi:ATP:guanido phosphotransferase, N-terminal domain
LALTAAFLYCLLLLLLTAQAGIDAPHLGVGIVAGDEESYEAFKDIYDKVIEVRHFYSYLCEHPFYSTGVQFTSVATVMRCHVLSATS